MKSSAVNLTKMNICTLRLKHCCTTLFYIAYIAITIMKESKTLTNINLTTRGYHYPISKSSIHHQSPGNVRDTYKDIGLRYENKNLKIRRGTHLAQQCFLWIQENISAGAR